MKWHRHQDSAVEVGLETGVVECCLDQSSQFVSEVDLATVFEIMHQCPAIAFTMQGGPGELEIKFEAVTVRANKHIVDFAVETLATTRTKWSFDVV